MRVNQPAHTMKITKVGHCCSLSEEKGIRILADPGMFSIRYQNNVRDIDIILITHDHQDHLHIESLKIVLKNNPRAKIITNKNTGILLKKEGITFDIIEDGQNISEKGVLIEGFGKLHAVMHSSIPQTQNTGYFIANRLFYPGDAFTHPGKNVEILALPVAGPWMKLTEAIDYALELKPKICFPVHEGILVSPGLTHRLPKQILEPQGIQFIILEINQETEV